jgi:hypothetical protein
MHEEKGTERPERTERHGHGFVHQVRKTARPGLLKIRIVTQSAGSPDRMSQARIVYLSFVWFCWRAASGTLNVPLAFFLSMQLFGVRV